MANYESDKLAKLSRLPHLRILNMLGMVGWRESAYGEAEQKLRLMHPLAWLHISALVVVGAVLGGVPEVFRELPKLIKEDCVWW